MGCKQPREQVGEARVRPSQPERVDDVIDMAAGTVLSGVAHLETNWDCDKLRWKVASYFRNAAKEIVINGTVEKVVDDFADCAFCRLMSAISDRVWLCQVDFTLLLDAAVKATLPVDYLNSVPVSSLEDAIVKAHDRAFEEARATPVIWDAIEGRVDGKKAANKVYNAFEVGRGLALKAVKQFDAPLNVEDLQAASMPTMEKIDRFCRSWINSTINEIAKACKGDPAGILEKDVAELIFSTLLTTDILPQWLARNLVAESETFAPPHPFLDQYLQDAYQAHQTSAWPPAKRQRMQTTPRVKSHMCYFHFTEGCTYGDNCQYGHSPAEITLTVDFKCPDWVREMFPDLGAQYDVLMKKAEAEGTLPGPSNPSNGWSSPSNGWSSPGKQMPTSPSQGKSCWGDAGPCQGKGCWGDAGMDGWNPGAPGKGCWGDKGKLMKGLLAKAKGWSGDSMGGLV